jgi:hypothetical protein
MQSKNVDLWSLGVLEAVVFLFGLSKIVEIQRYCTYLLVEDVSEHITCKSVSL